MEMRIGKIGRKSQFRAAGVLAAGTLLLAGCGEERSAMPTPPVFVGAVRAESGDYRVTRRMIAEVKPLKTLHLVARVGGFLAERNFAEGAAVKSGDVLYRIEPASYELAVKQAEAALAKARAQQLNAELEYERAAQLFKEQVAPPKRYDIARANLQSNTAECAAAEAALGQARLNLSYTEIRAPFDGWIGLTRVDVGNYVGSAAEPLAELLDIDEVRVEFNLSDRYLSARLTAELTAGHAPEWPVTLYLPDGTRYPDSGRIRFWSNRVDTGSATLKLQALFANTGRRLIPGLFGTVELTDPVPRRVTLVDERAVLHEQASAFVYVVNPKHIIELRRVETGPTEGNMTVIESGLAPGERVALPGNPRLRPGAAVEVVTPPPRENAK